MDDTTTWEWFHGALAALDGINPEFMPNSPIIWGGSRHKLEMHPSAERKGMGSQSSKYLEIMEAKN